MMADLKFIGSYGQGYPERFDGVLDSITVAIVCSFNRPGTLLAVGCNDGRIIIWDIMTRRILKSACFHVHPVTSLNWSRYGHSLLAGSSDWTVSLFEVANSKTVCRYHFASAITSAEFHPRDNTKVLVCSFCEAPCLISRETDERHSIVDPENFQQTAECSNIIAQFDRRGTFIFTENGSGKVRVLDSKTLTVVRTFWLRTHSTTVLTSAIAFEFSHRGRDDFLINCNDRAIRLYRCQDVFDANITNVEPIQRFRDLVTKSIWKRCCFSNDGEYVAAGASRQHSLYIWERNTGGLVKILNGTKGEILQDIAWHPTRAIICSVSNGLISVWNNASIECWSAYAPNFRELEENIEYEEKEGEFDIEDEDDLNHHRDTTHPEQADYSEYVEIIAPEKPLYCSSDEDGNEEHLSALSIGVEDMYMERGTNTMDI